MTLFALHRNAIVDVEWPLSAPVPLREKPTVERAPVDAPELATLKAALASIPNNANDSLDYESWRDAIFGIHHATEGSDDGLALAHEFSARSPKYDPDFLDNRVWPYVRSDRDNAITARTIFAKARAYGYEEPVDDDFEVLPPPTSEGGQTDAQIDSNAPADTARSRFEVLDEDALLLRPRPRWFIKGVVPMAELGVLYGASGSGKSFEAIDMFAAVARGVPWRGLKTQQAGVIYIPAEGQGGFRNRLEAYQHHHQTKTGLRVIVDVPNLLKADAEPLAKQIVSAGGAQIIVIDTLAQVSPGGDENSAEDMGKLLLNCRKIQRATGALIMLIHHAGKDLSKGARGWSGLKAAADIELEVNRLDNDRWLKVTKSKDGEDGAEFPFRLLPITIAQDDDGDDITSCVVEHVEPVTRSAKREPGGKLERIVWRTAHDLSDLSGGVIETELLIAASVERVPRDSPNGRDRRREWIRRALLSLGDGGFLQVTDAVVTVGV